MPGIREPQTARVFCTFFLFETGTHEATEGQFHAAAGAVGLDEDLPSYGDANRSLGRSNVRRPYANQTEVARVCPLIIAGACLMLNAKPRPIKKRIGRTTVSWRRCIGLNEPFACERFATRKRTLHFVAASFFSPPSVKLALFVGLQLAALGGEMDDKKLNVGLTKQRDFAVTPEMRATSMGNSGADILVTPILAQYLELAAMDALAPALEPGDGSHGISIAHPAAPPVRRVVHLRAKITEINGRKVNFSLTANDDADLVATATTIGSSCAWTSSSNVPTPSVRSSDSGHRITRHGKG